MYSSRLPSIAAAAMASSLLVVLPMAETTTTGRRASRAFTMDATRSRAAADSTDVPPNFMTIISVQQSFRVHQLSIQDGCAGRPAYSIVAQGDEFVVQHRALAQA